MSELFFVLNPSNLYCKSRRRGFKKTTVSIPLRFGVQYGVTTEIHLPYARLAELELVVKLKKILYKTNKTSKIMIYRIKSLHFNTAKNMKEILVSTTCFSFQSSGFSPCIVEIRTENIKFLKQKIEFLKPCFVRNLKIFSNSVIVPHKAKLMIDLKLQIYS